MQPRDELAFNLAELPSEILLRNIFSTLDPKFVSSILVQVNKRFSALLDTFYWKNKIKKHFPDHIWDGPFNQSIYKKIEASKYPGFTPVEKELVRLIKESDIEGLEKLPITPEMFDKKDSSFTSVLLMAKIINNPSVLSYFYKMGFELAKKNATKENGNIDYERKDSSGRTILYWALRFEQNLETLIELTNPNSFYQLYFKTFYLFHFAIMQNRLDFITAFFNDKRFGEHLDALIEQKDGWSETPLILAAKYNHNEIISFLLDHKADYRPVTRYTVYNYHDNGKTAFHWLVKSGNLQMVKIFIEKFPQLLDEKDIHDQVPLMWAVQAEQTSVVAYLLEVGANPYIRVDKYDQILYGKTALHLAIEKNLLEIVKIFIERFPLLMEGRDIFGEAPLIWAAKNGHDSIIKYLVDNDANPNIRTERPNHPNNNKSPLYWACENRHHKTLELLIKLGAMDNHEYGADKLRIIHLAVTKGIELTQVLMETIPDIHYIAEHNRSTFMAKDYIKDLPNLHNQKNAYQQTPLLIAAEYHQTEIVKYLLDKGANPNVRTYRPSHEHHFRTALYWAYLSGNFDMIVMLMSKGADATLPIFEHEQKTSIMHLAAHKGQLAIIKTLVENDINPPTLREQKNAYGETPLLLAAYRGYIGIVEYLLSQSANPNVSSFDPIKPNKNNGKTPLAWAYEQKHLNIVAAIFKAMHGQIDVPKGITLLEFKINLMNFAVQHNDVSLVKILVEENEAKNEFLNPKDATILKTPLLMAMQNNSLVIAEYLLSQGADPDIVTYDEENRPCERPLHWALQYNKVDVITLLVKYGADRSLPEKKSKQTPIEFAVWHWNLEMVQALLENNSSAPFSLLNDYDKRSFLIAALKGYTSMVKYFLRKDTELNEHSKDDYKNVIKKEALSSALANENISTVFALIKSLVKTGATINTFEKNLFSILRLAILRRRFKTIKFCLQLVEDNEQKIKFLNQKDSDGRTLLMLALDDGSLKIIEYLLNKGANPTISAIPCNANPPKKITPIELARQKNDIEMVKLLKKYDANKFRNAQNLLFFRQNNVSNETISSLNDYSSLNNHNSKNPTSTYKI